MVGYLVEDAIRMLTMAYPEGRQKKPSLFHSMRVGSYLYTNGYSEEICVAGLLHDAIEDTDISEISLSEKFGNWVLSAVKANSKNKSIPKEDVLSDIVKRCVNHSEGALIVKSADVLDNFVFYSRCKSEGLDTESEILRCRTIAKLITENLPNSYSDKIFEDIKKLAV